MATLEDAISIAALAHKEQTDKAGSPYILHPLRMMMQMESETAMMAAVLHDVVEDTDWTLEELREKGFSNEVLEAVECLTKREGKNYESFIERVRQNKIATEVKIAHLEDNMNIRRIHNLQPRDLERLENYHKYWKILKNHWKSSTTTLESATRQPVKMLDRMTPERKAETIAMLNKAMLKGLAHDNLEIFGTPIPDELKD